MTHETTRREFLVRSARLALTGAAVQALLPGWALALGKKKGKGGPTQRVVVVFLRGGADALHVVVPLRDPRYREVRPGIGIAPKPIGKEPGALGLDKRYGFHPALSGLMPLFEKKQVAPLLGVGSPHPSRSHFDCMDFMERAAPGDRTVRQGWLNRYLTATRQKGEEPDRAFRAVAMQGLLPRSLRGTYPVLAVPQLARGDRDPLDAFEGLYEGGADMAGAGERPDPVLRAGQHTVEAIRRMRALIAKAPRTAVRYPGHGFGQRLSELAPVLKSDAPPEVSALDYPGWDHHAREGGPDGKMAQMLKVLGDGLAAFAADLGPVWDETLVLVMSEFGRTVKENGNLGTDHGHGGMMLALGGRVAGGKVYGHHPPLDKRVLYEGRDLPVQTDFRAVFDEVLETALGFRPPRGFFPGYRVTKRQRFGFLKKR